MNAIKKYGYFAVVFGITLMLMFGSARFSYAVPKGGSSQLPEFQYAVSGCEHEDDRETAQNLTKGAYPAKKISVAVEGDKLHFTHALSYVCCAKLRLEHQIEERARSEGIARIAITEINEGDYCRCMCDYSIEANLGPLAEGTYDLKVLGVGYRPPAGQYEIVPQVLFQTQLNIVAPREG